MVDDLKFRVLASLPRGKANAITGENLAILCGEFHYDKDGEIVADTRKMRLTIQELIDDGEGICSSPNKPYGYFYANTPEEFDEALKTLKYGYGLKIFKHYRALKKAKAKMFGSEAQLAGQLSLRL